MRSLNKKYWPYKVNVKSDEIIPDTKRMETWLKENLGEIDNRWYIVQHFTRTEFYFQDSKDATLFSLIWV